MNDLNQRFYNIFDADTLNPYIKIVIVGIGTTGSNVAVRLAELGLRDITVIDFDRVEAHNCGHQAYRINKDVGRLKTEALREIIEDKTGTRINIISRRVHPKNIKCDILVNGVDSMRDRKRLFEQSDYMLMTDSRMSGEGVSVYTIGDEDNDKYLKTLFDDSEAEQTLCGQRSIGYMGALVSALMAFSIKKALTNQKYSWEQHFCAKNLIYHN